MVQRQIDQFFKKSTPQKGCAPSPFKKSQESQDVHSQDSNLSLQHVHTPNSSQRLLFHDSTSSNPNKRTYSQLLQQSPESIQSENSLLNYFSVQKIKHSKANTLISQNNEDICQETQSSILDLLKNKKQKLNEDSNSVFTYLRQDKLEDSRLLFSQLNSLKNIDKFAEYQPKWTLPINIMLKILSFLEMKDLFITMQVNRNWKYSSQKCLKNYHLYFQEFSINNLTKTHFNYLKNNSELIHIKYITQLFKKQKIDSLFEIFKFSFKLSQDYNQDKSDKMFETIIIQADSNRLKYVSVKTLKKMLEKSRNSIKILCIKNLDLPKEVYQYIHNCRELEELYLQNNYEIDDSIVQGISSRCKKLKILQLSYCPLIEDQSIDCISSISNLQRLDLSNNHNLKFQNISKLQNNKNLISLSLKNTKINNQCLESLLNSLQKVRRLNLDKSKEFNFLTVKILNTKIPKSVRFLSIDENNVFSENQINDLLEKNEGILRLNVTTNCNSERVQMKLLQNKLNMIFKNIESGIRRSQQSVFNMLKAYKNNKINYFIIED
ncbi:F-box protein (macronuclear) [Tetrahymena thermophila SB210]|uniref:F-box protein n=1 Tax=Tetrahymena thermophila (strain SB210) TaxID=312017 RepID=Q24DR5_TETTS|nr:F-box protein [Tetrahymena thermophila SB210]EAS05925.3 F-box protein [Tetrahymena thermophila SB210]|eukprot:XP_001026170.3 F-box protein [Tetrahymena thermophila SB210]